MITLKFYDGNLKISKQQLLKLEYFQSNERFSNNQQNINPNKIEFNFEEEKFSFISFNYILDLLEERDDLNYTEEHNNVIDYFGLPYEYNINLKYKKQYEEDKIKWFEYNNNIPFFQERELRDEDYNGDDFEIINQTVFEQQDNNEDLKYNKNFIDQINNYKFNEDSFKYQDITEEELKNKLISMTKEINEKYFKNKILFQHILNEAIKNQDINYIKFLLTKEEIIKEINTKLYNSYGFATDDARHKYHLKWDEGYCLNTAANLDNDEIFMLLLDKGANPNTRTNLECYCNGTEGSYTSSQTDKVILYATIKKQKINRIKKLVDKKVNFGVKTKSIRYKHNYKYYLLNNNQEILEYIKSIKDEQYFSESVNTYNCYHGGDNILTWKKNKNYSSSSESSSSNSD